MACLFTGSLSPVRMASSSDNLVASSSSPSPGAFSPALSTTRSPGTSSHTSTSTRSPIPDHGSGRLEQAFQGHIGALRLIFLDKAQDHVNHHHCHDDGKIALFTQCQGYPSSSQDDVYQWAFQLVEQNRPGRNTFFAGQDGFRQIVRGAPTPPRAVKPVRATCFGCPLTSWIKLDVFI